MAGRKTAYRKIYAKQAREACAMGNFSLAQLGRLFGVDKSTVWKWRQKHPEFDEACTAGYENYAVAEARGSLTKLVKGYSVTEVTKEAVRDKQTGTVEMQETKRVRKHVQPSINAVKIVLDRYDRVKEQQQASGELSDLIAELDGTTRTLDIPSSELFSEYNEAGS